MTPLPAAQETPQDKRQYETRNSETARAISNCLQGNMQDHSVDGTVNMPIDSIPHAIEEIVLDTR